MSFGKDTSRLNLPNFRQQQQQTKGSGGGGGGGRRPHWVGQYRPTTSAIEADRIRLHRDVHNVTIADQQNNLVETVLSYFPWVMHGTQIMRAGKMKFTSAICSGGPLAHVKEKRLDCEGCERHWNDRNSMSRMSQNAFTILHFGDYAKVPSIDDKGQPRINNKTKEPFFDWERTSAVQRRSEHAGLEIQDYNLLHWSLGYNDYNMLGAYAEDIAKACLNCNTKGAITSMFWCCEKCGADLIDPQSGALSPEDIAKLTAAPVCCGRCEHTALLVEITECKGCTNPVRADIFDVDLFVKKPINTKTGKSGDLLITGWDNLGPVDPKFTSGPEPIFHQMELEKIYAPHTSAEQRDIFGGGTSKTAKEGGRAWGTPGQAPRIGG